MARGLRHLGNRSVLTARQIAEPRLILESFDNPKPQRDYQIDLTFPEFTSMCPVTGQPDFATIHISYVPGLHCVEMKSLKLYFLAYRNQGIFYEAVVNQIADDLIGLLKPRQITVTGDFAVRGGLGGTVIVTHPTPADSAKRNRPPVR
jgi:7-cyano-7-deazaguanine reductase